MELKEGNRSPVSTQLMEVVDLGGSRTFTALRAVQISTNARAGRAMVHLRQERNL